MLDFLKEIPPPPAKKQNSSSNTSTNTTNKAVIEFSSYESDRDKEINTKAEKRRQSLQNLLEENQNVLAKVSSFGSKKSLFSNLSVSSSNSSLNKQETMSSASAPASSSKPTADCKQTAESKQTAAPSTNMSVQDQEKAYRASGAIPKKPPSTGSGTNVASITKPLPAIVEPPDTTSVKTPACSTTSKKKVGKAKSLNIPSNTANQGTDPIGIPTKVIRQSSVPEKLELGKISASLSASSTSSKTSPCANKLEIIKTKHLSPSGGGATLDTSGIQVKGSSHESLSDQSTDSGAAMSAKNSKSPSPNRSDNICLSLEIEDLSKKSPTTTTTRLVLYAYYLG